MILRQDRDQLLRRAVPQIAGRTLLRAARSPRWRVACGFVDIEAAVAVRLAYCARHRRALPPRSSRYPCVGHSEMPGKLLIVIEGKFASFSECALKLYRDCSDLQSAPFAARDTPPSWEINRLASLGAPLKPELPPEEGLFCAHSVLVRDSMASIACAARSSVLP